MGQYKPPMRGRPIIQPSPSQIKAAIEQAKRHIQTQKEVADLLADKIEARACQREADARLALLEIKRLKGQHKACDRTDIVRLEGLLLEISARHAVRRANARFAAAEIAHMTYEHDGLLMAIDQSEKQIEQAEHPSPIVQARVNLG